MGDSRRLVVLDPGLESSVGHHSDVNSVLLPALRSRGWRVEIWGDSQAARDPTLTSHLPELRPLLRDSGYIDPRHWCDLPGNLHQAALLRPQLEAAVATGADPVAAWLAHSLVPFQLIALAQVLQHQPPAQVVISLMFAPGEVFAGQPELNLQAQRAAAELNSRSALGALALAVARAGHQLRLCAGSKQLIERYGPFCAAAGLAPPELHPAVVIGDGGEAAAAQLQASPVRQPEQVLLHWGERKPDKGRELSLALLEHLLDGPALPPALANAQWCFHAASHQPPEARELALLRRAAADGRIRILEGQVPRPTMLKELVRSRLVLLPYSPQAYAERSSGVLWLYGAARLGCGQPARVVGHAGGWLAAEARALGMGWSNLPTQPSPAQLLAVVAEALARPDDNQPFSAYGRQLLAGGFGPWVVNQLEEAQP